MENKSFNYRPNKKRLINIINLIKKPAGDAFDLKKAIEIPDNFIKSFHNGYKKLHYSLISDIITIESLRKQLLKNKSKYPRDIEINNNLKAVNEILLIFRRANDCIAWVILGMDRNYVRRLCLRNTRGNLKDQNPDHVLEVLYKLNSPPFNLAIWNDATTCIDVGDILAVDRKKGRIACIELKEGIVNETIDKIINSGCERAMYFFLKAHGNKGKKQFERILKQYMKYSQIYTLLREDKGIDPFHGEELQIVTVKTPDEFYHKELDDLIDYARYKGVAINKIDECLWLFAFDSNRYFYANMIREFSKQVLSYAGERLKKWLKDFSVKQNSTIIYPIFNLITGLKIPESLPIFLYPISPKNILDILLKNIVVLMFLDWDRFKDLYIKKGISLVWSSKKEARRMRAKPDYKELVIIGDRIPMLTKGKLQISIAHGTLVRIFFDGIKPICVADQLLEMMQWSD